MTRVAVIHHGSYLGMERREGPLYDSELLKHYEVFNVVADETNALVS